MTEIASNLKHALLEAGYSARGESMFQAIGAQRTVAIVLAGENSMTWPAAIDEALRNELFRLAPSWSRYLVVIVNAPRTATLAAAASIFCRDVSRCRKLVAFPDQTPASVLPFLPLPPIARGTEGAGSDVESVVQLHIRDEALQAAFLSVDTAITTLQTLAERTEVLG